MYNSYLQTVRTIENPPMPLEHTVESGGAGLMPNAELVLHGTPYGGSKKGFIVEFLGQGEAVALHFNPRFKFFEHTVVLNTADGGGKWQKEERHSSVFRLDQAFKLQIFNHGDEYKIVVNDKDFCSFRHRIPAAEVTRVKVHGDVRVQKLQLILMTVEATPNNPPPSSYPYAPAPVNYGWSQQPPGYTPTPNMPNLPQPSSNPSLGSGVDLVSGYPPNMPSANSFYPSLLQNPLPNMPQGSTQY